MKIDGPGVLRTHRPQQWWRKWNDDSKPWTGKEQRNLLRFSERPGNCLLKSPKAVTFLYRGIYPAFLTNNGNNGNQIRSIVSKRWPKDRNPTQIGPSLAVSSENHFGRNQKLQRIWEIVTFGFWILGSKNPSTCLVTSWHNFPPPGGSVVRLSPEARPWPNASRQCQVRAAVDTSWSMPLAAPCSPKRQCFER